MGRIDKLKFIVMGQIWKDILGLLRIILRIVPVVTVVVSVVILIPLLSFR